MGLHWKEGGGELLKTAQRHKLPVIRQRTTRDVMYNMIKITNMHATCYK